MEIVKVPASLGVTVSDVGDTWSQLDAVVAVERKTPEAMDVVILTVCGAGAADDVEATQKVKAVGLRVTFWAMAVSEQHRARSSTRTVQVTEVKGLFTEFLHWQGGCTQGYMQSESHVRNIVNLSYTRRLASGVRLWDWVRSVIKATSGSCVFRSGWVKKGGCVLLFGFRSRVSFHSRQYRERPEL